MNLDVERTAVRLLAERATPSLSLRELHALVVAEIGPGAGSYARFRDEIDGRADVFAIVLPDDPLVEAARWPTPVLTEYRSALRAAGLDAEPRVVLARSRVRDLPGTAVLAPSLPASVDPGGSPVLGQLGASLLELLGRARDNAPLARLLGSAMADAPGFARALAPLDAFVPPAREDQALAR